MKNNETHKYNVNDRVIDLLTRKRATIVTLDSEPDVYWILIDGTTESVRTLRSYILRPN